MINIDMEMPKSCNECDYGSFAYLSNGITGNSKNNCNCVIKKTLLPLFNKKNYYSKRHPQCPLKETPLDNEVEEALKFFTLVYDIDKKDFYHYYLDSFDGRYEINRRLYNALKTIRGVFK